MFKYEPVRLYGIFAAVVALVAYYVDIPAPLVLGVGAALFVGGTEATRHLVTPTAKPD